jgi:nickel-type superoxide dismutase maturation protease
MLPLLKPDDQVLIRQGCSGLKEGDVVAARHPHRGDLILIKEIESITDDGRIVLAGLNRAESTDSRQFGAVERADVIGKVTGRL